MANRIRPKKYKLNDAHHPYLRKRWIKWLPSMSSDITDMLAKKEIFWELQDIAKENPEILKPDAFFDWMCRNYVISQAVGIRSFIDSDKKSHSLWRLLYEALENPGVINRTAHLRMYRKTPNGEWLGNKTFNAVVGEDLKKLGQKAIRTDMRQLEDSCERIRKFVNKRIAHRTNPGQIRRLPVFNELDEALKVLDRIFCKYNLLLRAQGLSTCEAVRQYDWREVLWEPWVNQQSKFRP